MERKIGEIFEYHGEWYQCIEDENKSCGQCDLSNFCPYNRDLADNVGNCSKNNLSDGESIIFKKLEKVGGQFACRNMSLGCYGIIVQRYKVFAEPILTDNSIKWCDSTNQTILIALINKEDMEDREYSEEEFKNNPRFQHHKSIEQVNNMKKMKPFNLEQAKAGKPVCTRDGRKARIICWDRIDSTGCNLPIVALVQCEETEVLQLYHDDGKCDVKADLDLMMLPEKKEGWVNVYPDDRMGEKRYSTKEEASCYSRSNVIDTVKIEWEE